MLADAVAVRDVTMPADTASTVTVAGDADRAAWSTYVSSRASATGYHDWAWRDVIERTFGHACFYLIARRGGHGEITGVLPLVEIRSLLFGRTMTSVPFVNYGGVLADSTTVAEALVASARDLARTRGCRHVELRHIGRRFDGAAVQAAQGHDAAGACRRHVGPARSKGPQPDSQGDEIGSHGRARRRRAPDRTSTPSSRATCAISARRCTAARLFDEVLQAFPDRARLIVVRHAASGDAPIAAGLTFRTGPMVEVPWASSIHDFNALCPNHLLVLERDRDGDRRRLYDARLRPVDAQRRDLQVQGAVGRHAGAAALGVLPCFKATRFPTRVRRTPSCGCSWTRGSGCRCGRRTSSGRTS